MTKDEVLKCNDGQKLANEVAVLCMGWTVKQFGPEWYYFDGVKPTYEHKEWQPHLLTEKGKAQCFDLAQKYDLELDFVLNCARYDDKENELTYEVNDENMQIAILKAALLCELGE